MVCHSEYCLKVGEQRIRDKLLRFCAFFPLCVALMSLLFLHSLRDNIFCNGREEVLRFDITNFLKPVFYNEFVVQGPLYHPYSILLLLIGGFFYRFKYYLILDIQGYSHAVLVPLGYFKIFRFLWNHDKRLTGEYNFLFGDKHTTIHKFANVDKPKYLALTISYEVIKFNCAWPLLGKLLQNNRK